MTCVRGTMALRINVHYVLVHKHAARNINDQIAICDNLCNQETVNVLIRSKLKNQLFNRHLRMQMFISGE